MNMITDSIRVDGNYKQLLKAMVDAKNANRPLPLAVTGLCEGATDACYAALDLVIRGWDESQGALFYEFCEGESWHSKNLKLLTEHCNTRFYE